MQTNTHTLDADSYKYGAFVHNHRVFLLFFFCCASFVQLSFIYPVYPIMVAADFLVFVRIQFSSLEQRLFKLDKQGRRIFTFYQWNLRSSDGSSAVGRLANFSENFRRTSLGSRWWVECKKCAPRSATPKRVDYRSFYRSGSTRNRQQPLF